MDLELTEIEQIIQNLAREVSKKELLPIRSQLDEEDGYPLQFVKKLGELGLSGVYIPGQYGGAGQGVTSLCLVMEEISKVCAGASTAYGANALFAMPILLNGTEEQKEKYLTKIAAGEYLGAFGLTEAAAGSDALALQTKAVKDGNAYILNGGKEFITNAEQADVYVIFAVTNPNRGARGISGFIVEKGTPGFTFGKKEKKMGIRCSETRSLGFNNCRVPAENLLGSREGIGAIAVLNTLFRARIGIGAQAAGLMQGAYQESLNYAKQRKQFGQNVTAFQAIQHKLADMAMKIETSRLLVYKAARTADDPKSDKDAVAKLGAMAKCYASDRAMEVASEAIQICGGIGYMRDFPAEKYLRDAKILQIYEGTNEIQRNEIAAILIKESAK